jgi:ATP-dependent helicase/nuclease subunit A
MIITYTEAAAKEMRTRITKKLRERLHTHSDPALVRRQLSLLPSAQISTIHAACLAILRQNFEPLGLDPQFSVAEKSQLTLMKIDLLDDFIEGLYKDMSADDDARTVIEGFFKNNSDRALIAAIDKISAFHGLCR